MHIDNFFKDRFIYFGVFIYLIFLANAFSAPLEEINLVTESSHVSANIKLSGPVANVRYTPQNKGSTLTILLDKLPVTSGADEWVDNEVLKSPPNNLIPSFIVKTNLKNIQPKLVVDFSREAEYTVQIGRDGRSIILNIKIDKPLPANDGSFPFLPEIKPVAANADESNQKAYALIMQGKNALANKDNFAAVDALNKLLLLPPNDYTPDGQEWVGVARERAGQPDKAKLEYELYLKLYPTGVNTDRVKQRLARLNERTIKAQTPIKMEQKGLEEQPMQRIGYGSLSMHYYHGATKVDTTDVSTQFTTAPTQSTFTAVDQSSLITSVDATERFVNNKYDNRVVFRDTAYSNFLDGQTSRNRVTAAYYEFKDKTYDYSVRAGRQSSSGAGVLGRFDGINAGWGFSPGYRINAVAGQLSDYIIGANPVFYGASADMGPVSIYGIRQTVEGYLDRQAVGTELRYFDQNKSAFTLIDYDTSYSVLNIAMLQGTLISSPELTFNMLLDHRRAPYISTRNALIGSAAIYINDLMQGMSVYNFTEEDLRNLAAARTGASNMAQIGFSKVLTPRWQWGADLHVSSYEGLAASGWVDPATQMPTMTGVIPDTPGTGNDVGISTQLVGSNLYSSRDSTVMSVSYSSSPVYNGKIFYIYNRSNPSEKWSFDTSIQYYRFDYTAGTLMTRLVPMIRVAYQVRQSLSLDMDAGMEISHSESAVLITDGQRQFYSIGFRYDF